jgi:hypothetical protein
MIAPGATKITGEKERSMKDPLGVSSSKEECRESGMRDAFIPKDCGYAVGGAPVYGRK